MNIKEILIINQPIGNRGDESAHRALVRALNKALPETHITILSFLDYVNGIKEFIVTSSNNDYVRFLFSHNYAALLCSIHFVQTGLTRIGTFIHPVLRRLLPYYKRADLVLCAPGGICMGGFQNWRHLYLLQLARIMHKPIAYYSRSIGPFPEETALNRKFKKISLEMLRSFFFLSLRDRKSKCIAEDLGVQHISAIDTAFLEQPRCEIPSELKNKLQEKYVVFVPNQLTWHYAYRNVSPALINSFYLRIMQLLRQEYPSCQIVMLPQLCSLSEDLGDYKYFKELQRLDGSDDIFVVPDTYSSDIQQTVIAKAQCVVGARYHTIVFAVNNEVPFVALNYEHKIAGLLEELGLSDHIADIAQAFINEESVTQILTDIATTLKQVGHICPQRDKAHQMATDCFKQFILNLERTYSS